MASNHIALDNGRDIENGGRWGHSGFLQFDDGSLDHLAVAEDRVELDLFDDGMSLIMRGNALYCQPSADNSRALRR